nr:hypothetical protein CFP56_04766 [Quercus suber]POF09161.1 hypothetical protein CFP56_77768 [Quercus suber]
MRVNIPRHALSQFSLNQFSIKVTFGYFAPLEVDLILKIPHSSNYDEDKLVWPHTANGIYSVKSGYNFLAKEKTLPLPVFSNQGDGQSVWKKLWSLAVPNKVKPNKVKNFLWRASREAIPMKKNLVARRLLPRMYVIIVTWPLKMSIMHCGTAKNCLPCGRLKRCGYIEEQSEEKLKNKLLLRYFNIKKFSNFFELVRYVLEENKNPALFATLVWKVWSHRNSQQAIFVLTSGHLNLTDPPELYPSPTDPKSAVRCSNKTATQLDSSIADKSQDQL